MVISDTEKGMPPGAEVSVKAVGQQGWNVLREDMTLPVAILKWPSVLNNAQWMQRFASEQNVWLYPHGKTTMAPQLFDLQQKHGCRGVTVANAIQADICLRHSVRSVFIANQVTDRQSLLRLAGLCEQYDQAELFLIVDSAENANLVLDHLAQYVQRDQLKLLIEIGMPGGRTGVRSVPAAVELATLLEVAACKVSGLEAFEGIFNMADFGKATAQVEALLELMGEVYAKLVELDKFAAGTSYLSAGGSAFYDLVATRFHQFEQHKPSQIIVRSGCYISHDSGMYKRAYQDMLGRGLIQPQDQLLPALEVWGQVQSQPEQGRAFANAGKRDLSYDIELPVVNWWYRPGFHHQPVSVDGAVVVQGLNDQHAYLSFDNRVPLQVGDLLGFGISHPCTTFDKWKYLFAADDDYNITGVVKTFF